MRPQRGTNNCTSTCVQPTPKQSTFIGSVLKLWRRPAGRRANSRELMEPRNTMSRWLCFPTRPQANPSWWVWNHIPGEMGCWKTRVFSWASRTKDAFCYVIYAFALAWFIHQKGCLFKPTCLDFLWPLIYFHRPSIRENREGFVLCCFGFFEGLAVLFWLSWNSLHKASLATNSQLSACFCPRVLGLEAY